MFLTDLGDFDFKPYINLGEFTRGEVVNENAILWECEGKLPEGVNSKIVVQAGFVTDLASLPWFTAIVLKKLGRHQRAAVLHDSLTRHNIGTFLWAIKQFDAAMKQDGVVWWRRGLIVSGLTVGGYPAWKNPSPVVIV